MNMSRHSLLLKWAFLYEIITGWGMSKVPFRTDLCAVFWRSVLGTPIFIIVWLLVLPVVAFFALVGAFIFLMERLEKKCPFIGKAMNEPIEDMAIFQRIRDYKRRTCTVIDIVE